MRRERHRGRQAAWLAVSSTGFGTVLSLNAFTLWGTEKLLGPDSAWPWAASEMGALCLPANVLTFLLYGLLATRLDVLSRRRPVAGACALLALGAAALAAACLADAAQPWTGALFKAAGALLGAGGALAFVCWETTFFRAGAEAARRAILVASAFSTAPYLLLAFAARGSIVFWLTGALVPCCIALLVLSCKVETPVRPAGDGASSPCAADGAGRGWRTLWPDLWAPLACTMMVGVVGPAVGAFATLGTLDETLRSLLYQLANLAAVAVLALCWFKLGRRPTIEATFLTLVPVAVVVLFLFPFWSHGYQGFVVAFGCFVFSLVSILMMVRCIELAELHGVGIGAVYGLFAAGMYFAQIAGAQVGAVVGSSSYPRQFQVVAVVVLLLWGLSALALVALPRVRAGKAAAEKPAGEAEEKPGGAAPVDAVALRCAALADAHRLSPREAEVLDLIAHGRDVGAIAEILGLSRNTVRTHVQRLYADLDVHTRQELIDLVELGRPGDANGEA